MAILQPFKALRFTDKAGDIASLCCPPYDIINDEQRNAYLAANKNNIIRLELPREGEDYYTTASEVLKRFYEEGILSEDDSNSYYIYSERFFISGEEYEFKGIIARVKIEEFSKGVILPHEETLSKAKTDRFNLMKATMCNFSQIYSLYNDKDGSTSAIIEKFTTDNTSVACFTDSDGVSHTLWRVSNADIIDRITAQFADRKLYIADGHHRYETALNFRNHLRENNQDTEASEYVMMMLVPMESNGLVVFPTHRVIKNLDYYNVDDVLTKCSDSFEIEQKSDINSMINILNNDYSTNKTSFAYYVGNNNWYLLTLKNKDALDNLCPNCSEALKNLDVNVLHKLVLERSFSIDKENMSNQKNLIYTRDVNEALELVDSGKANCSFIMNPTKVSEISAVASAGEKMPQKSTYFYPKLITGLVMNKLGDI